MVKMKKISKHYYYTFVIILTVSFFSISMKENKDSNDERKFSKDSVLVAYGQAVFERDVGEYCKGDLCQQTIGRE